MHKMHNFTDSPRFFFYMGMKQKQNPRNWLKYYVSLFLCRFTGSGNLFFLIPSYAFRSLSLYFSVALFLCLSLQWKCSAQVELNVHKNAEAENQLMAELKANET